MLAVSLSACYDRRGTFLSCLRTKHVGVHRRCGRGSSEAGLAPGKSGGADIDGGCSSTLSTYFYRKTANDKYSNPGSFKTKKDETLVRD